MHGDNGPAILLNLLFTRASDEINGMSSFFSMDIEKTRKSGLLP
jgi:hypothetical protein